MSDATIDVILPILEKIQQQLAEFRLRFDRIDDRLDGIEERVDRMDARMDARFDAVDLRLGTQEGRFAAFAEMTNARFTLIENAIVDLSARTHVLSTRLARIEKTGATPVL